MKIAHPDFHFVMDISENKFPVLVLEQSGLFYRIVSQMAAQADGIPGPFVISENWEHLEFEKAALVITDLFHLDLNGRKQMTALAKRLSVLANSEHHIQATLALQEHILQWAFELEDDLPYITIHNETLDMGSIIKTVGIKFDDSMKELPDRLNSFIKICAGYLNIRIIIIVGLHSCLEESELNEIYKTAMYEKVSIVDVERCFPDNRLPCEEYYIIDRDNCEIYNDSTDDIL